MREATDRMIRRFFYHFFWNFYDALGVWTWLGAASIIAILSAAVASVMLIALIPVGLIQVLLLSAATFAVVTLTGACIAGLCTLTNNAADDMAVRVSDFKPGARRGFVPQTRLLLFWLAVITLFGTGAWFYGYQSRQISGVAKLGLITLAAFCGWSTLLAFLGAFASLPHPADHTGGSRLSSTLRSVLISLLVAPRLWFVAFVFYATLVFLFLVSIIGAIYILPVAALASTTASWLSRQHVTFLEESRKQLGEGRPFRDYTQHALRLGEAWEARQPKRTLRDILRPWDA